MTQVSGQIFGKEALGEGYLTDSMGIPIDPNAIYTYTGIRYGGLTRLVRAGLSPKKTVPLTRVKK